MIEVTQADRDAAAELVVNSYIVNGIIAGKADDHFHVQAFARHRLQAISSQAERIEVLEGALVEINDAHLPDQPATSALDEREWAIQHIRQLRKIARSALASDGEVG